MVYRSTGVERGGILFTDVWFAISTIDKKGEGVIFGADVRSLATVTVV